LPVDRKNNLDEHQAIVSANQVHNSTLAPCPGRVCPVHSLPFLICVVALAASGCSSALRASDQLAGRTYVEGFGGESRSVVPGRVRLRASVCADVPLAEERRALHYDDFVQFLRNRGYQCSESKARPDLVYVDVTGPGLPESVRFRVAVLASAGDAGRDLHLAVLQHGKGRWGVHRSNLAVLGPEGTYDDILAFAARSKLACWGVLTLVGLDDTFVIPGGYAEL